MKKSFMLAALMLLTASAYAQDTFTSTISVSAPLISGSGTGSGTWDCAANPFLPDILTIEETQTTTLSGILNGVFETTQTVVITQDLAGVVSGTYTVTACTPITGANGCGFVDIGTPKPVNSQTINTPALCDATGATTTTVVPVPPFGSSTTNATYTKD